MHPQKNHLRQVRDLKKPGNLPCSRHHSHSIQARVVGQTTAERWFQTGGTANAALQLLPDLLQAVTRTLINCVLAVNAAGKRSMSENFMMLDRVC